MKLHNTLNHQTEVFAPINNDEVRIYSCGPTVYNYAHIGNLRSFVFADTLRRALEINKFKVKHVMNITDVGHLTSDADSGEDKLEKGAQREGKTVNQVAEHYTQAFLEDVADLNILKPNGYTGSKDGYARATDFIADQIKIVEALIAKGCAYITEQAIYFDVTKLPDYGKLSGQKLKDKEVGARDEVVIDNHKHHPYDFAVWFFTVGRFKDHSLQWDSPWGKGFPGWHLECSAIIHKTLGEPIDIHTGGVDHIGTHHTNEMAQTEAAFGHDLARYWMHNEFVLVENQKMAKSTGNFYILKDVKERGFDASDLRLLYLQSHYRAQMNFTWDNLAAAHNRLKDIQAFADLQFQAEDYATLGHDFFDKLQSSIQEALANDLNTPEALKILSQAMSHIEQYSQGAISVVDLVSFKAFLAFLDSALGLSLALRIDINNAQRQLINSRQQARNNKDWAKSDDIRAELEKSGIGLKDTTEGAVWYRL